MSDELKDCPFCGGRADFERRGTPRQSCIVACINCGARHESSDEGESSGNQWNDRAPVEITDAMVEAACAAMLDVRSTSLADGMRAALRAAMGVK